MELLERATAVCEVSEVAGAETEEAPPPIVTNPDDGDVWITVNSACAHKGRLVVFLSSGRAFERANDGSWSPYQVAAEGPCAFAESVILG